MSVEIVAAIAAAALLIVALGLIVLIAAVLRLLRDARAALAATARVVAAVEAELPPTLGHARDLIANLNRIAAGLEPRLEHLDLLLDEAEQALAAVQSSAAATERIARAPLATAARVRRGLRSVGLIGGPGRSSGERSDSNRA